ncbi:MAG: 2-amino-4-hydroxy-6-hydroxymethyldihydropteridine diphosphokinase [Planctomycetia bacterium]|nr:2-amino-4-hydroxy-6-hydroxymethyldihydropteridine diphosphokinase [Planctomycetia bacterium]
MARCLIGCGSNLGKRREQLDRAVELLRFMPGVTFLAASRYRETRPVGGPAGQSAFLNGACLIETELTPHAVLEMLAAVENTLHRERHERWGERTIDLDLLLYGDLVLETAELTVPHPRMATRRFVLEPSAEIAAEFAYPPAGCTVGDLLDNISATHPLIAVVGVPGSGAPEVAAAVADAVMGRVIHAPTPLPLPARYDLGLPAGSAATRWSQVLAAWAEPLNRGQWDDDPHPVIADYWLDELALAAADDLRAADLAVFEADFSRLAEGIVAPQVAIMLMADRAALAERIAFRSRHAHAHTNVFGDLATQVADVSDSDRAAALVMFQDRLARRLRCLDGRGPRSPKAVITVDAGDLGQAIAEATAAVEAML